MPSMPSVPLISASPSLAASSTGVSPAAASASAAGTRVPEASRTDALAHQRERAVRERCQVTGAAERAVLVDDRRDARVEQPGDQLRHLRSYAGPAGRQCGEPQQHQPAHDLALHLGPRPGGVRAHQRTLQLRAHGGGDVPCGESTEAGRDAVRRGGRGGELLDDGPSPLDRGHGFVAQPDRRSVADDGHHVGERGGVHTQRDDGGGGLGGHGTIQRPRRSGSQRRGHQRVSDPRHVGPAARERGWVCGPPG